MGSRAVDIPSDTVLEIARRRDSTDTLYALACCRGRTHREPRALYAFVCCNQCLFFCSGDTLRS